MKLVRFLMNLPSSTNQPITVELKNGNSISGQLLSCSPSMNLSLKNIKLIQSYQDPQLLDYMNIRGNQIRQIILPDEINIDGILAKSVTKLKGHGAGPGAKPLPTRGSGGPPRGGRSGGPRGGSSGRGGGSRGGRPPRAF